MTEPRLRGKNPWWIPVLALLSLVLIGIVVWWYGPWNAENRYKRMDLVSLRRTLDDRPNDFVGWKMLGMRLAKDGDRIAETPLRQAHALNPADPEVTTALGELLLETKRLPEAFE